MLNKSILSQNPLKIEGLFLITVAQFLENSKESIGFRDKTGGTIERIDPNNTICATNNVVFFSEKPAYLRYQSYYGHSTLQMISSAGKDPHIASYIYVHINKNNIIYSYEFYYGPYQYGSSVNQQIFSLEDVGKTFLIYIGKSKNPPLYLHKGII